jgi:hypothetical protein
MVSVPVENHNIYNIHHHLSPNDAHTFNATWTVMHTLQECIHVLQK